MIASQNCKLQLDPYFQQVALNKHHNLRHHFYHSTTSKSAFQSLFGVMSGIRLRFAAKESFAKI